MENGSMRRRLWTAIAVLAFGCAPPPGVTAFGYGAIAWDRSSFKRGWSSSQETPQKAGEAALDACGASGCMIVIQTGPGQCAALARTNDRKFVGAASRGTEDEAKLAALEDCRKRPGGGGDCTVRASNCNYALMSLPEGAIAGSGAGGGTDTADMPLAPGETHTPPAFAAAVSMLRK
jgi:Domain of unknown function (DUF4189)